MYTLTTSMPWVYCDIFLEWITLFYAYATLIRWRGRYIENGKLPNLIPSAVIIGASLSEPHTSESDSAPASVYIYIYIYICLVRTSYRICVQNSIFA